MSKNKVEDRLELKRKLLIERTARALGIGSEQAENLLALPRRQSIRLNPLIAPPAETLRQLQESGYVLEATGWAPDCYYVKEITGLPDSPEVARGAAFIQNAASWLPIIALSARPGDQILDVCAAPGGKTSHIAALVSNEALITANDNSRARLMKLQRLCRQTGASVERFTLFDARFLARKLEGEQFDKILLDAPCSGEGLMNINRDKDFETWSVAHIKRLQTLQKKILTQAWRLLKPGGTLVYSTCTMAPEENEAVIDYGLRALDGAQLTPITMSLPNRYPAVWSWNGRTFAPVIKNCLRLAPSERLEAFFVARLVKGTTEQ